MTSKVYWEDDKGKKHFDSEQALICLLTDHVIFLNNHWWEENWPEEAREVTSLNVNCNDVFAWGCADGEEVTYKELQDLYDHWEKDPSFGSAIWCCKKRNCMPQVPVADSIRKEGVWDIDSMGLRPNQTDKFFITKENK